MGGAELPLLFAIFLDLAGFGMVIPDVQTRLETLGASGLIIGSVLSSRAEVIVFGHTYVPYHRSVGCNGRTGPSHL